MLVKNIRNIAIIAHVDHGKTTLVDTMMRFCNLFRKNQVMQDCFLDSNDQERERGITILSKNISLMYKGIKINLIDTPGHADFSGEVERILKMADGAILLVDAHDGVMPQTKFVLKKALEAKLKPLVVMNKMDRPDGRPQEALDSVYDLFIDLSQDEDALDFPVIFASGKNNWSSLDINKKGEDLAPLMDSILENIPPPEVQDGPLQMQITSFEYSDYVGRIGIGRVFRGAIHKNEKVCLLKNNGDSTEATAKQIYVFNGLGREETDCATAGDLCAIVGIDDVGIGDTLADLEHPEAMPAITVEEPTISMVFAVNDSPFYGQEGKYVTSRHIRDYLMRSVKKDVSLRVETSNNESHFKVFGRGILHLSVMIENMRRAGYELAVGQPQVVNKKIDGKWHEPVETLMVEVGEDFAGKVIEEIALRKGELQNIEYNNEGQVQTYIIPSRGLIGLRTTLLNSCSGDIVMHHRFLEYRAQKGEVMKRKNGVITSMDTGAVVGYALSNLQDRGTFFVSPGDVTYRGMIIGEHCKSGDVDVNIQKEKKLSNMRASGKDKELRFAPAIRFSLEEALEFIQEDEWVEVTSKSIRLRKKLLDPLARKKASMHQHD
ncbi:MAG: translational GTPase TypA [Fibrobacteria bacterium]|nr:translational GTPase TypA [Fibrobacteria bacterium]